MSSRRLTSNGIHHMVKGADHDKHPNIKKQYDVKGFCVLEIIAQSESRYQARLMTTSGVSRFDEQLPPEQTIESIGEVAVMQGFLEGFGGTIARANYSTSSGNNPQVSGNLYMDK